MKTRLQDQKRDRARTRLGNRNEISAVLTYTALNEIRKRERNQANKNEIRKRQNKIRKTKTRSGKRERDWVTSRKADLHNITYFSHFAEKPALPSGPHQLQISRTLVQTLKQTRICSGGPDPPNKTKIVETNPKRQQINIISPTSPSTTVSRRSSRPPSTTPELEGRVLEYLIILEWLPQVLQTQAARSISTLSTRLRRRVRWYGSQFGRDRERVAGRIREVK
ncbi:hypothetical protein B0H12DRAFT_1224572 [Mycena haematopus]|nr:hypothetical protein B0H12DRAFT_1224572 [Mycena haematopus]